MFSPTLRVASWEYPDISAPAPEPDMPQEQPRPPLPEPPVYTEDQLQQRLQAALAQLQAELRAEAAEQQRARDRQLSLELASFGRERAGYYRQVETEVVHLALAIARKLLAREASLDPTLLHGLVRVALDRLHGETAVRVRVPAAVLPQWQHCLREAFLEANFELVPDAQLVPGACLVESGLGVADFSFEAQLKEVEQSFTDLLARRPLPE